MTAFFLIAPPCIGGTILSRVLYPAIDQSCDASIGEKVLTLELLANLYLHYFLATKTSTSTIQTCHSPERTLVGSTSISSYYGGSGQAWGIELPNGLCTRWGIVLLRDAAV